MEDWDAVTASLGLPTCELLRVNQTPEVECPDWTPEAIEAIGRVCGDDVEGFGWNPPKVALAGVRSQKQSFQRQ